MNEVISSYPKIKFEIIWRPFQLNPNISKEGMDRQTYLEKKFGGKEQAKNTYESIYKKGINNNIYFQFDKIKKTPNSFASHKLLALAHRHNNQAQVIETLFYSYFIEGLDIGDFEELIIIAKQHKIYDENTLSYLKSKVDNESLLLEEKYAKDLGIKGVPCFIINKEIVLFGAQDKKNFLDIFEKIKNG
mgnify:FL=1